MKALIIVACAVSLGATIAAQSPTFEVASIKRNTSGDARMSMGLQPGGRWVMRNGPILDLITSAYPADIPDPIGLPAWASSERYDVETRAEGTPTNEEVQAMLRALLEERFRLKAHYETREEAAYALVRARSDGGVPQGVQKIDVDCAARSAARLAGNPVPPLPAGPNGMTPCSMRSSSDVGLTLISGGITMARLGRSIANATGRPLVIDRTGLGGDYAFTLRFMPTYATDAVAAADDRPPSIFVALEEQLGLKLEPTLTPARVLVIDSIERPSED